MRLQEFIRKILREETESSKYTKTVKVIEDDFKNESTDDEGKKKIQKNLKAINVLLSQVSWEGLCDIWVEYNQTDREYEIRSKYVSKDFNIQNDYFKELEFLDNTIREMGMRVYIFSPWFVDSCDDEIEFMNESEDKKPRLLSTIDEDGLYQVMQDTGLSLQQIISKTGELPREVFEGYIKDFIINEGHHSIDDIHLGYGIELPKGKHIDSFYMKGDNIRVELYDTPSSGSMERLSNLSDKEIIIVVKNMINFTNHTYG